MKDVYTHIDSVRVGLCKSILLDAGIPCFVRNENSNVSLTEIPIPVFYPTLCVRDNEDYDDAIALIKEHLLAEEPLRPAWVCPSCQQEVPGGFEICWNCQADTPSVPGEG